MSEWTWKQAVAECVLDVVNGKKSTVFTLDDIYQYAPALEERFPANRFIREKSRQTLQRLRDDGFVRFSGEGEYEIRPDFPELDFEPLVGLGRGTEAPATKTVFRHVRLRDTFLASEIKKRYGDTCQVCRLPVRLTHTQNYSEAHHLRPLGYPHLGPDTIGNIMVVCPNHHAMFDRGAIAINPATYFLEHIVSGIFGNRATPFLAPWHKIAKAHIEYHYEQIYAGPTRS